MNTCPGVMDMNVKETLEALTNDCRRRACGRSVASQLRPRGERSSRSHVWPTASAVVAALRQRIPSALRTRRARVRVAEEAFASSRLASSKSRESCDLIHCRRCLNATMRRCACSRGEISSTTQSNRSKSSGNRGRLHALLVWASCRPFERRVVAPLTFLVVGGIVVSEIAGAAAGVVDAWRVVPTWCLQAILLVLFAWASYAGRQASHASRAVP